MADRVAGSSLRSKRCRMSVRPGASGGPSTCSCSVGQRRSALTQQRALAGLGERGAEAGGDGRLALGVQRAGDQHQPRLVAGREREAHGRRQRLVGLVLDPGEHLRAQAEAAVDVGDARQQRQVDQAGELALAGDARDELVAAERDQDADEQAEEEREHAVADRLGEERSSGGSAAWAMPRSVPALPSPTVSWRDPLADGGDLDAGVRSALQRGDLLLQRLARVAYALALEPGALSEERLGYGVGRARSGDRDVVGHVDADDVGIRVDGQHHVDGVGGHPGHAPRGRLEHGRRGEHLVDGGQPPLGRVRTALAERRRALLEQNRRGRDVGLGQDKRYDHRERSGHHDDPDDQRAATAERVQVAPDMDPLLGHGFTPPAGGNAHRPRRGGITARAPHAPLETGARRLTARHEHGALELGDERAVLVVDAGVDLDDAAVGLRCGRAHLEHLGLSTNSVSPWKTGAGCESSSVARFAIALPDTSLTDMPSASE